MRNLLRYLFASNLGPNIHLIILFSNTLSLRSSLTVRDHVSQPYSTTVNIIVLYILNVKFINMTLVLIESRKLEDRLHHGSHCALHRSDLLRGVRLRRAAALGRAPSRGESQVESSGRFLPNRAASQYSTYIQSYSR